MWSPTPCDTFSGIVEHRADGFFVADATNGFCQQFRHAELANAFAVAELFVERNRVSHYQFIQIGRADIGESIARQNWMRTVRDDARSPVFLECSSGFAECTRGVDHVVNNQAGSSLHFADDMHDLRFVGLRTTFVDDGQVHVQVFGNGARAPHRQRQATQR